MLSFLWSDLPRLKHFLSQRCLDDWAHVEARYLQVAQLCLCWSQERLFLHPVKKTENSFKCQAVSQNPSQDCVWKLQTCVCKEGGCFPIHCSHQKKHDITYLPLFGYVPWTGPGLYWQHGGLGWTWLNLFFLDSVVLCDVDGWRGIAAFCYGTVYKSLNAWCFHQMYLQWICI